MMVPSWISQIDKKWALFLDRDGVINVRLPGDYVKRPEQFVLLPNVKEAMQLLRQKFGHVFLVTNQQGIGKQLMTESDLERVHQYMNRLLDNPFDKIYHCSELAAAQSPFRKPEIGMALQAKEEFPAVDFSQSVMVGDAASDMQFGEKAGMKTVFIRENGGSYSHADCECDSLYEFSEMLGSF